jgi:hypothetical protein
MYITQPWWRATVKNFYYCQILFIVRNSQYLWIIFKIYFKKKKEVESKILNYADGVIFFNTKWIGREINNIGSRVLEINRLLPRHFLFVIAPQICVGQIYNYREIVTNYRQLIISRVHSQMEISVLNSRQRFPWNTTL